MIALALIDHKTSTIYSKSSLGVLHKLHLQGGQKRRDPLWYQNIAVFKTFLGTSLTECDESH